MKFALWKQSAKRNILFWGKNAEMLVLILIVYLLVFTGFFSITDGEGGDSSLYFVLMVAILAGAIGPASCGNAYLPLVISMGARRKEAVWGLQFLNFLIMVQMEIVAAVAMVLEQGGTGNTGLALVLCFCCLLISAGAGQIGVAAKFKWGNKGMIAYFVILFLGIAFAGLCSGFLAAGFYDTAGTDSFKVLAGGICLGGILFYAAGAFALFRTMRNYEVRI